MPNMRFPDCMGEAFDAGLYEIGDLYDERPVVVRNIPGAKCSQCGYLLLPAAAAKNISRILAVGNWATTTKAYVYDLAEIDVAMAMLTLPPDTRTPGTAELAPTNAATPEVRRSVESTRR